MKKNILGKTGLEVSRLGIGLSEIGFNFTSNDFSTAEKVLNVALDEGINFLDTAACYDISEETIGSAVSYRRNDYILATKAGHYLPRGEGEDWTYELVTKSIERSLIRLKTDYLDLVQLHSCDISVLEKGEVIRSLLDAKATGKVRFIGYSGDNENAVWAVTRGLFDTLQTSFSIVDQSARINIFPEVVNRGIGLIIKRPIGNGVWGRRSDPRPYEKIPDYTKEYFKRAQLMIEQYDKKLQTGGNGVELALRFTLSHKIVNVAIVGSQRPDHVISNAKFVTGLSENKTEDLELIYGIWDQVNDNWKQLG